MKTPKPGWILRGKWRCAACGLDKEFDKAQGKPDHCAGCHSTLMEPVERRRHAQSPPRSLAR